MHIRPSPAARLISSSTKSIYTTPLLTASGYPSRYLYRPRAGLVRKSVVFGEETSPPLRRCYSVAIPRFKLTELDKKTLTSKMAADKITDWVKPGDTSGEFKRQASSFRDWISDAPGAKYPPEKGRYHLYVSYACPWAHRTLIARKLKGLEEFVSFSVVHWHLGAQGWRFATAEDNDAEGENVIPDPLPGHAGYTHLRNLYFAAEPNYTGRFTVPVLFDKKTDTIVNNESSEILRMFGSVFNAQLPAEKAAVDLYPESLRTDIDEAGEWTYDMINNGVYKSGFATTQDAYERNVVRVFEALDRVEAQLVKSGGPYFFGQALTEIDLRDPNPLRPGLRPAFQVQHTRHPERVSGRAQLDAQPVLEPRVGRLQGHDEFLAHQVPLHQEPHPDQPPLYLPGRPLA
ncbi:glutathione S-transferase [Xylaria digitata]|nr:glutathione S-transferase [Xylaria digitata]